MKATTIATILLLALFSTTSFAMSRDASGIGDNLSQAVQDLKKNCNDYARITGRNVSVDILSTEPAGPGEKIFLRAICTYSKKSENIDE